MSSTYNISNLALLSNLAYEKEVPQTFINKYDNDQQYKIIKEISTASGYQALAIKDPQGNIIISHRGTEISAWNDLIADLDIGTSDISQLTNPETMPTQPSRTRITPSRTLLHPRPTKHQPTATSPIPLPWRGARQGGVV